MTGFNQLCKVATSRFEAKMTYDINVKVLDSSVLHFMNGLILEK